MRPLYDPEFLALLKHFDPDELHTDRHVVYGLWRDFRLAYMNAGWFVFAAENRGEPMISREWSLGRALFDAIPEALAGFYAEKFHECLRSGTPWSHEYECSSDEIYRKYHQTTYPLDCRGLVVINALVVETPINSGDSRLASGDLEAYYDTNRFVHQCCHCRRVNNLHAAGQWDWVPQLVKHPDKLTTHAICPHCLSHYYPEAKQYL